MAKDITKGRFSFTNQTEATEGQGSIARVSIVGVIGDWWAGYDAESFTKQINQLTAETVIFDISTPGGDYYDALTMYRAIKAYPGRTVSRLSGMVASAGTILSSGTDETVAAPELEFMIHGIILGGFASVPEWEEEIANAKKSNDNLAAIYARKSSTKTKAFFKSKINSGKDNWMTASEAKAIGLVDRVEDNFQAVACAIPSEEYLTSKLNFKNVPDRVKAKFSIIKNSMEEIKTKAQDGQEMDLWGKIKALAKNEIVHENKLKEAQEEISKLNTQIQEKDQDIEAKKAKIQELTGQVENMPAADTIESLNQKIQDLETENAKLKASSEETEKDLQKSKEANADLVEANETLAAATDGKRIDIQAAQEETASAGKKMEDWEIEKANAARIDAKLKKLEEIRGN